MIWLIVRRVVSSLVVLLLTTFITFLLIALIPGDAARSIAGVTGTQAAYERIRSELMLNQPLWDRYMSSLGALLHGDLGKSFFSGQPVSQELAARLPVTLTLIIGATILSAIIGIVLGAISAKRGGILAGFIDVLSLLGLALPNFWLALLLISAFAIAIPIFPATGYVPFGTSPQMWLASITLPVIALAIGGIAQIAKVTRDGVSDALGTDYIRTLRATGVGEGSLLWRHALKNSGVSIVTVVGLGFVGSLAGTLFVENVFVLPGLGSLVATATTQRDIPVIQGVALAYALIVIIVNIVIDVSYALLNPKVKSL